MSEETKQIVGYTSGTVLVIIALIAAFAINIYSGNSLYYADQKTKVEAGLSECVAANGATYWSKSVSCPTYKTP